MDEGDHLARLRRLPAVGALLTAPELSPLIQRHGKSLVTEAARAAIDAARAAILGGQEARVGFTDVARAAELLAERSLRRVINGTGTVLHTNLGRAPLARAAERAILEVARGYSSLEVVVETGARGDRHRHTSALIADVLDPQQRGHCEGGLVFNNNAGAMMILLAAHCRGREVIVARGELVEIGGGFRIPEVLKESGATLVEVGTTNKVYVRDYAAAITERTAAVLRVHRSNFALVGFVAEPSTAEVTALCRERGLLHLVDNGSGLLASEHDLGPAAPLVRDEPRPADALAQGADLVAFSGDKLLGGPQAGIIAGKEAHLAPVRRHPLARALRADKLTLAALEATLRLYRDGRAREVPALAQLAADEVTLTARAQRLAGIIERSAALPVEVVPGEALAGGGSLPLARFATRVLLLGPVGEPGRRLAAALRAGRTPVLTRVVDDRAGLDVRTLFDDELEEIGPLVAQAWSRSNDLGAKEATR